MLVIMILSCVSGDPMRAVLENEKSAMSKQSDYADWDSKFAKLTDKQLVELLNHSSQMISVRAGWEYYVVRPALSKANGRDPLRIDRLNAARFVAFCNGTLPFSLPTWMEEVCASGHISSKGATHFFSEGLTSPLRSLDADKRIYTHHSLESVILKNDKIKLVGSMRTHSIPLETVSFGIAFDNWNDEFHVCIYDDLVEQSSDLRFFKSGLERWNANIWGAHDEFGQSGARPWFHWCNCIRTHNLDPEMDVVFVVGIGYEGMYIEGFDSKTGEPRFRFLSSITVERDFRCNELLGRDK